MTPWACMDGVIEAMERTFDFNRISAALVGKVEDQARVQSLLS